MQYTERYARQIMLPEIGLSGQQALARASVLIVGAGGLGSPISLYLCTAGIGRIGLADELMELVAELPTGFRTVFNLFVVEGYNHKEIGEMLGITESTSRSQLTRAKKWLQKRISEL